MNWIRRRRCVSWSLLLGTTLFSRPAVALTTDAPRASVGFLPNLRWGTNVAYFQTSGSSDNVLFAPGALSGSRTGSPNTAGLIGELTYNAWQNTRLGLQYVAYGKFNGASTAYDVPGGRRAADNNTLYLYTWMAF